MRFIGLCRFAPLLLVGCLLAPSDVDAQPEPSRWTPELTMEYDNITTTEVSPDGEHVAYVLRRAVIDDTTSEYRRQVHVAATDGSSDVQYTRGEHSNYGPKWSPDGRRIAFLSTRTEKPQVHIIRLQGGEAYPVTDAQTGVNDFAWGPTGERIAYTMTDPKSEAEREREKEKRDEEVVGEEFRYNHLYVTTPTSASDTTAEAQRLTEGTLHVTGFDWAPNGKTIAFSHQPDPRTNSGYKQDISTVRADSGAVSPLVERPGADTSPHYSPNGRTIAFESSGGQPEPIGLTDIYTVTIDGNDPTKLADTPNREANLLDWTADGDGVLVSEAIGTSRHVLSMPSDGEAAQRITSGEGVYGSVSYSRSADKLAFTYQNSDTPAEVYLSPTSTFHRTKLTNVHADVPKPEMGRTELVTWSGPGGLTIEGLLTYPVDYEKGERVPLVLDVHGGPAGVHNREFTGAPSIYMIQVFAQNGYAVLRPNPRGSTGYGKSFRYANQEDWGYGDFEDLMAGVDKTIDMGVAHPDSLALMGWSYGGYMTSFAVTKTDRFKAASMGAGLPNLISMTGTTDIPNYLIAHMGGEFWENYETYEKHSAIYHIENVTTPTQVLHGAEDERVPTSQGKEFYRALNRREVPTELVLYPRTPHGPREPKLVMDVTPRILSWFNRHLGRSATSPSATPASDQ